MRFAFRVDASIRIGSGHIVRCATLAKRLQEDGAEVVFLSRMLEGNMFDWLRAQDFAVEALAAPAGKTNNIKAYGDWLEVSIEQDIADTKKALRAYGRTEWLVVDHYALDFEWEQALRGAAASIMAFDDFAMRRHDVDLLLNQNLGASASHYGALVPPACRLLMGPRYAILRPQFSAARQKLRRENCGLRRLLICFGGVDAANATKQTIEGALAAGIPGLKVDVVLGGGNPHTESLLRDYGGRDNLRILSAVEDMASLMTQADLFCGSAGGITWERATLGLPGVTIALAANQKSVCEEMAIAGADLHCGDVAQVRSDDISASLQLIARSPRWMQSMSEKASAICDGKGTDRIVKRLHTHSIQIREARHSDCAAVFQWRNHPSIRAMSGESKPLDWAEHQEWFIAALENGTRFLLIGEQTTASGAAEPVGVVRFDINNDVGVVSIYLLPGRQGVGLGLELLSAAETWLRGRYPAVGSIVAHVLPNNKASIAMFAQAGYLQSSETLSKLMRPR